MYPDWWDGLRFDKPINALALGESWSQLMNPKALHELIFGPLHDVGSGWLPKDRILKTTGSGQLGAYASVEIEHVSGGISTLKLGTYNAGFAVLMGSALDFVLIDECPRDRSILPQCIKRTWTTNGSVLCSFTPEFGLNETVEVFWDNKGIYHKGLIHATLFDSTLYTDSEKQRMVESIPPWQREFSIYGRPSAGQAAVFSGIMKTDITMPIPDIQRNWKRLCAIDFGYKDPTVVLFGAKDPNTGAYYIYDEIVRTNTDIPEIAPAIVSRQKKYIPMVFPADGYAERGLGTTMIKLYQDCGVLTTDKIAANWLFDKEGKDRSISTGIIHLRSLMRDGKLFISPTCQLLLKEFDLYAYGDDGKFIDANNHAIDALRYLIMSLDKFGKSEEDSVSIRGGQSYIPDESW